MAAPILERSAGANGTTVLLDTSGSILIETGRLVVTDCPAYAWNESDQPALYDLGNMFDSDLVTAWRRELNTAAHSLIRDHLTAAWAKRGHTVEFLDDTSAFESLPGDSSTPSDETYWAVWTEAAGAITAEALVAADARLGEAFPLRTDLGRHRDALHHRLDELASDDMCARAEQQIDGLRVAADAAVTRAQLIEISAQVDALVTRIPA